MSVGSAEGRRNPGIEMNSMNRRTRFQVNRVDTFSGGANNKDHEVLPANGTIAEESGIQGLSMKMNSLDHDGTDDPSRAASPTMLISPVHSSDLSYGYDTKYTKSFRHFTREALPRMDNYRNIMSLQAVQRPTLDELHNASIHEKSADVLANGDAGAEKEGTVKFGWIRGVLVRCLLNIWGVMLFLRLSWVVGQAGIGLGVVIVLLASVVTTITSLSMSAISTNGMIKGGGTYYMISRSLGPEFGASIGMIFSLANALAVAMYTVGFAESMNDLLTSLDTKIVDGGLNDIRIIGCIAIVGVTGICVIGMEWESKAQVVLLFILVIAMFDFVIGSFVGPLDDEEIAKGFLGYGNGSLFAINFPPDYRYSEGMDQSFFSVFSIFFPAATGILAGANISGDLRDPQMAIPKGTILAILITTISYIGFAVIAGGVVAREASGHIEELNDSSFLECANRMQNDTCEWGLLNSFQVMELVSVFGPLIYAGCFAATLSSALASFVSAPKVFQALCKDKLYPYITTFAKGYGKNNEPIKGYVLTFFIALIFILLGNLNSIAPLISNFFLAAYALVNFSTFHATLVKPIGWRPTFKYYNMWISLIGAILCIAVMFLISWPIALVTLVVELFLYLLVLYRKPDVNWGSSTQAQTYKSALQAVQQLNNVEDHVKNYRPQLLVLTGMPGTRPPLVDFASLISKNLSLMICGHVVKEPLPQRVRNAFYFKAQTWLRAHKMRAFYTIIDDTSFEEGVKVLLQTSGVGKLRPNILLMGYKGDWRQCNRDELREYFNIIHKALDMYIAVAIVRLQEGLDYSKVIADADEAILNSLQLPNERLTHTNSIESLPRNQSFSQMSQASSTNDLSPPDTPDFDRTNDSPNPDSSPGDTKSKNGTKREKKRKNSHSHLFKGPGGSDLPKDVLNNLTQFQKKQNNGTIDVWWLYDDGGLTLLLPYIINTRRNWQSCKLRVFALANKKDELDTEHRGMASLLAKFRIDYSDLIVIPDINKRPQDSTKLFFENLIQEFKEGKNNDGTEDSEVVVTESEILALKDKTARHLRLRELLQEHSKESTFVVMTLPMPRKGTVSAPLYMAWIETLTKDMPPFLLVRGNQQSVLTFYS